MKKGTRWIAYIVLLLVGNIAAVSVLMIAASGDTERRVIPDYYRRAVAWNQTASAAQHSLDLGWKAEVEPRAGGLEVTVRDRDGGPLADAFVRVTATPRSRASGGAEWVARQTAPGRYATDGALAPGLWDVGVQVHRADVAWSKRLTVEAR